MVLFSELVIGNLNIWRAVKQVDNASPSILEVNRTPTTAATNLTGS